MAQLNPQFLQCLKCDKCFIYLEVLEMHMDTIHPEGTDAIEHPRDKEQIPVKRKIRDEKLLCQYLNHKGRHVNKTYSECDSKHKVLLLWCRCNAS